MYVRTHFTRFHFVSIIKIIFTVRYKMFKVLDVLDLDQDSDDIVFV